MGAPSKVIHIVEDLRTGGLEKVVRNIVVNLDRATFDPEVWCLARGGEVAEEITAGGVSVCISEMGLRPSPLFLLRLAGQLRRAQARIVHCHGYTACTTGRTAAILAGTPRIYAHIHTQGSWLKPRQRRLERVLSAFSTKIICVSESVREFVVQGERIPHEKTAVVYNGIPDPAMPSRACARKHLGIQEGAKVLGYIASLASHKGHSVLIEAARLASAKITNLSLLIVGDGMMRGELETRAHEAGINAIFTGRMEDVCLPLAAVDAVALLSPDREGLGMALIEAMSASKPVIGARVGGIPEVVDHGVTGLLCGAGDADGAARCMTEILLNSTLGRSLGEAGRRKFLEIFTLGRMVSAIECLYGS
ncbi:MAG TPA: glycosyltransferase [Candidatus Methylomirabilis sp.]|nr:glycosyltransferase [Candidatus Methylomirabilis sp.]